MKFQNFLCRRSHLLILTLLVSMLLPAKGLAQFDKMQIQKRIAEIDAELSEKSIEKDAIRESLNEISIFSGIARSWFNKKGAKDAQIKALEAERKKQHYDNAKNKITAQIKQRERERDAIEQLNGEVVVSCFKTSCTNMKQLFAEFNRSTAQAINLNEEHKTVSGKILALNTERDTLAARLESLGGGVEERRKGYQKTLETKKKDYEFFHDLAYNPNIWWLPSAMGPLFLTRAMGISYVSMEYVKQLERSGQKFNEATLANKIEEAQKNALAIKEHIKNETLRMYEQEIKALQKQIDALKESGANLTGNWSLTVGKSTSIIQVYMDARSLYHGVLVVNNLRDYRDGQEIFSVKQTSPNTFQGVENAYDNRGRPTTNDLKITVHSNDNYLTYASDSTIQMQRCP